MKPEPEICPECKVKNCDCRPRSVGSHHYQDYDQNSYSNIR